MLGCDNSIMLCCYKSSYWFEMNPEVFTDETIHCLEFHLKYSSKNEHTMKQNCLAGEPRRSDSGAKQTMAGAERGVHGASLRFSLHLCMFLKSPKNVK